MGLDGESGAGSTQRAQSARPARLGAPGQAGRPIGALGQLRLLVALALAAAALLGAVRLIVDYPSDQLRAEAFRTAAPCPVGTVLPANEASASAHCLLRLSGTVASVDKHNGGPKRGNRYDLRISPLPGWPDGTLNLDGQEGALAQNVRPGDRIVVTVWRGAVVSMAANGHLDQVENPLPAPGYDLAWASLLLPLGLFLLCAAVALLVGSANGLRRVLVAGRELGLLLAFPGLGALAAHALSRDSGRWWIGWCLVALFFSLPLGWVLLRHERRRGGASPTAGGEAA